MLGRDAEFRPGQREAVTAVLEHGRRALVVQRTGWGKSIVYWIATRVRRDAGHGPTIIISPLLSLMRNQLQMADRLGLKAMTINSSNREDWERVEAAIATDTCDVLMISPERFANEDFVGRVLPMMSSVGLFVVDEAHCISDWGHDFRPDYRRIQRILAVLPGTVPVLATTATANDRVVADVADQLGRDVAILRGPLARESLTLENIVLADQSERLAWLAEHVPELPGTGVIYCLTVADVQRVAGWLSQCGIDAYAYYGELPPDERTRLESSLLANDVKVLVATVALGMGFDKPDLGFVIHYQRPGSVVAYYQQVGRAGRALPHARGVLLSGREDDDIIEYFIGTAFPPAEHMEQVLEELGGVETMTMRQLESRLNLRRSHIEKALKVLEIDGAVGREAGSFYRTPVRWSPDVARMERVTAARRAEVEQMRSYVAHDGCLMEYLTRALDDPTAGPCGQCANETGQRLPSTPNPPLVERAIRFLKRDARPIQPRKRWPVGALAHLHGNIRVPNRPGFALCVYGDAGWGRLVADGKYRDGRFDLRLVEAAAELIRGQWRPQPAPTWLTAVPSNKRPGLLGTFGSALADMLGLPFEEVLAARSGPEQKDMQNSAQQLRNVAHKLEVVAPVPFGPVLLVDDVVDSGWTLTYAGWLLRQHGASEVHPFALAMASARGDT